jgi:hypothetical protein
MEELRGALRAATCVLRLAEGVLQGMAEEGAATAAGAPEQAFASTVLVLHAALQTLGVASVCSSLSLMPFSRQPCP